METIAIQDKKFRISIESGQIQTAISNIAEKMNNDLRDREIVFITVLNGAFMFATDLIRRIKHNVCISCVKLMSYEGIVSNGQVKQLIGLNEDLTGKTVVIIEDIIDSGNSIDFMLKFITTLKPDAIKIASLLFKPSKYKFNHKIDYVGFRIPDEFVVGFGLDYNGYGRNLENIYTLIES